MLKEHIGYTVVRFDSAKLFGTFFNVYFPSGGSVALAYQVEPGETGIVPGLDSDEVMEVERFVYQWMFFLVSKKDA